MVPQPGLMVSRLLLGLTAALLFAWVGLQLVGLKDYPGDLMAFYHLMGWFSFGMALVAIATALPRGSSG